MNSKHIEKYSESLEAVLWDTTKADDLFGRAVAAIDAASGGALNRDAIRTVTFTEKVMKECGVSPKGHPQ